MKAIAILLVALFMFGGVAQALVESPTPCSSALEWYMKDNGTWGTVGTRHNKNTGKYYISDWSVPGLAMPADDAALAVIQADYQQSLVDKQAEKQAAKDKTKTKLGMNDKQLEELKQALEITP